PHHHRVILVNHVVAVHHVAAEPVPEPHPNRDVDVLVQPHGIFARQVHTRGRRGGATAIAVLVAPTTVVAVVAGIAVQTGVTGNVLKLFEVDVNGMCPVIAVPELPLFHGAKFHGEARCVVE